MNRTDDELRTLAQDIVAGKVFTDRHCRSWEDLPLVFMPLQFMSTEQAATLDENGMLYEYLDKSMVRINGRPCFASFQHLTKPELDRLVPLWQEAKEAAKS